MYRAFQLHEELLWQNVKKNKIVNKVDINFKNKKKIKLEVNIFKWIFTDVNFLIITNITEICKLLTLWETG